MAESGKATDKAANKRNFLRRCRPALRPQTSLKRWATEWLECWQTRAAA